MKAVAVKPKSKEVVLLEDHPEPKISAPTEVKLKMRAVGICGTDKELVSFRYGDPPPGSDYLVIGHESLGVVEEVGAGVTGFAVGDHVVPIVRRPCDHPDCAACRAERPDFCFTGDYTERGIKQAHGYLTEHVVVDQAYLQPVPRSLGIYGVLTEPLTIAEKALDQLHDVQQRLPWGVRHHRAVVIGAGPVGLLGAMALIADGLHVTVYSLEAEDSERAELVRRFGADYVSSKVTAPPKLAERVGRIDVVYEAAGAPQIAFEVMEVLGTNGVFLFTGVPGRKTPVTLETGTLMKRLVLSNQVILGTVNAGVPAFEAAVRDLSYFHARWPEVIEAMVHPYPLAEWKTPLLEGGAGIKNILVIHEEDGA